MSKLRCLLATILILGLPAPEAFPQSPVAQEWKQRLTEGQRRKIAREGSDPFAREIGSATPLPPAVALPSTEETLPILSSLTGLLTQAATETLTFSREMRPAIEWPGNFWNVRDSEGWSWRKRLQWFRGQEENAASLPSSASPDSIETEPGTDGSSENDADGARP